MDRVFDALADESRRKLLDALYQESGMRLLDLCAPLAMSRQAVAKHLGILEEAGLVVTVRRGKEKLHYLNPVPLRLLYDRWLRKFDEPRADALIALRNSLEAP
jgi:DNA-binding transcriptional ArsR family regulator